jgi:hypothetical protein
MGRSAVRVTADTNVLVRAVLAKIRPRRGVPLTR